MIGLGLGWGDEWFLMPDGRVCRRTSIAFEMKGKGQNAAFGELSASYEDRIVPWSRVPKRIKEQLHEERTILLIEQVREMVRATIQTNKGEAK